MLELYSLERMAYGKIAEDQQTAARYWLSVEADKARREARQAAGSSLAGIFRTLVAVLGVARPVVVATAHGQRVQ